MSIRFVPTKSSELSAWVSVGGAVLSLIISATTAGAAVDSRESTGESVGEAGAHWAFRPLSEENVPGAGPSGIGGSQLDRFIEARLREEGLRPNEQADRYTLVRRATFDLTGLPPTPEEVEEFVRDTAPDAFNRLLERLLASPAYGERWGRHWLDLARYADTNGADENMAYPNAWRYRDYVIRSFNEDKPYDRFLREQIAGDLLPPTGDAARDKDQVIATGFLVIGPKMLAEQDKAKLLMDVVDEQIDVVTRTFMGLSVSCARCHDHKFDPVAQEDYYAWAGVFRSTRTMANTNHVSRWSETVLEEPGNKLILEAHEGEIAGKKAEIAELEKQPAEGDRDDRLKKLQEQLRKLESAGAPLPKAMAVSEGEAVDVPVHIRGDHLTLSDGQTPRGVGGLFRDCLPPPAIDGGRSGRMELANWLSDRRHPLTARVMANRVWQGHFGAGLLGSPSNFGLRAEPPAHPELLDWLARELVAHGWSVKHLHRVIMRSEAYRRSSGNDPGNALADPGNRYWWRQNRRRLEAEPIRDAVLFVSDQLDQSSAHAMGELAGNQEYYRADPGGFRRLVRAVYLPVVRANGYEMLATFDGADPAAHHERRAATIVPSQALFMLNSDLVNDAARRMAAACAAQADREKAFSRLFLRLFGRPARPAEAELLVSLTTSYSEVEGWERLCRVLLAANEFVYVH